jgi:hypothetical protein
MSFWTGLALMLVGFKMMGVLALSWPLVVALAFVCVLIG